MNKLNKNYKDGYLEAISDLYRQHYEGWIEKEEGDLDFRAMCQKILQGVTTIKKFNVADLVMKFSHRIDEDKIVFLRTEMNGMTLLGQLEKEINEIIEAKNE